MIIKKANIIAFGALKNKVIEFHKGLNIIYGENEAGKSTIQAFVKVWLYGFPNSRGKDLKVNERLKYTPLSGENIRGELHVEYDGKEYIINRSFGKTKKEDTSVVIEALTGEEVTSIPSDEPGKYFLSINRSTFVKTLFIGQLDVGIKKDKEEEILDKISNIVGVGEGDITIDKAFQKLENYKKILTNSRKSGRIDSLKDKYSNLINERYEGYQLSEHNLENEERLLKLKVERDEINEELSNLEIYKKYLKKIKLQKEYEDITQYLRKKEELEQKEKFIEDSLKFKNEVITTSFVNDIKEEHSMYLNLLDIKDEDYKKLQVKINEIEEIKIPFKKYEYIGELEKGLSQDLMMLKVQQDNLKEKIDIGIKIEKEISVLNEKELEARRVIGKAYKLKDIRKEVGETLVQYEEMLKALKYNFENTKGNSNNILNNKVLSAVFIIISIVCILGVVIINNTAGKIILGSISLILIGLLTTSIVFNFNNKKSSINALKEKINSLEKQLDYFNSIVEVSDYGQLIKSLRLYDEYVAFKEKIDIKISEKLSQRNILDLENVESKYKINESKINEYKDKSGLNSLDELIADMKTYEEISKSFFSLEVEVKSMEDTFKRSEEQISAREKKLREKLFNIGLNDENLLELGEKLEELKEKILLREEIHRNLISVDETYSALAKGKNIEFIKEELKDVINISFKYSYETEEEIDEANKEKSKRLLTVEKEIKDIENEIANRFKGKRSIPEIEEELDKVELTIKEDEKRLKATMLANEILKLSYDEIRERFGPILNSKVISSFKDFTNGKYNEVMVSDKYEMKVVSNNETIAAEYLSNGANDQLYLALRLAFIEMIFNSKNVSIYLDDAFVQYDDNRVEKILSYLYKEKFSQTLIFTCQNREVSISDKINLKYNYISL